MNQRSLARIGSQYIQCLVPATLLRYVLLLSFHALPSSLQAHPLQTFCSKLREGRRWGWNREGGRDARDDEDCASSALTIDMEGSMANARYLSAADCTVGEERSVPLKRMLECSRRVQVN
eukprot:756778-Hanusia_phi.AAC.2